MSYFIFLLITPKTTLSCSLKYLFYLHAFCRSFNVFHIFAGHRQSMKGEILYQKIAKTIAWQIKTGIWKLGDKLPSLRTISREYGTSLNTAIQAYYELDHVDERTHHILYNEAPARPAAGSADRPE